MYFRRDTVLGLSPGAGCRLRTWRNCAPASYMFHCRHSGASVPWASRRGFDTVVQTVSGITARQGELFPGAQPGPQFYPVSAIDYLTGYLMAFGALLALARRATEGGSWQVSISLAQIGRWLVGRGQVSEDELRAVPEDFTAEEIARWSTASDLSIGRVSHLAPVLQLSETRPHWSRPAVPLGHHEPVWP